MVPTDQELKVFQLQTIYGPAEPVTVDSSGPGTGSTERWSCMLLAWKRLALHDLSHFRSNETIKTDSETITWSGLGWGSALLFLSDSVRWWCHRVVVQNAPTVLHLPCDPTHVRLPLRRRPPAGLLPSQHLLQTCHRNSRIIGSDPTVALATAAKRKTWSRSTRQDGFWGVLGSLIPAAREQLRSGLNWFWSELVLV